MKSRSNCCRECRKRIFKPRRIGGNPARNGGVCYGHLAGHKAKQSRTDYTPSENDNTLAIGVQKSKYALAYFGYSYYASNQGTLKALGIVPAAKKKE